MPHLFCRKCDREFENYEKKYICRVCNSEVQVENEIIRFSKSDFYWNIISREMMNQYLGEIKTLGWTRAYYALQQRNQPRESRAIFDNVMLPSRAGWKFLLPISKLAKVLDLGSGWGATAINMARSCGEVTAFDLTRERLESLRETASQEGLDNIFYVHAGEDLSLPFKEKYFDIVVVNGVMEWIPEGQEGDPRFVQLRFLDEVNRVLHPNGVVYLAIENRFSYTYFTGPEDHTQLLWGSLMPRIMSNIYSEYKRKRPYRTYTYSYSGYKRLFKRAGFKSLDRYSLLPNYRYPKQIMDLENNCEITDEAKSSEKWKKRIKESTLFLRCFTHSFGHIMSVQKFQNRIPGFLTLVLNELHERCRLKELKCVKYMIRSFAVLAFCRTDKRKGYSCVIRLPYGEKEVRRTKKNAESLRALSGKQVIVNQNRIQFPELLFEGFLNGQYVSVETWICGLDIDQSEVDFIKFSHQVNLFLIQLGKITLDESDFSKKEFSRFMRDLASDISEKIIEEERRHRFEQIVEWLLPKVEQLGLSHVWAHGDFFVGNCIWDFQKEILVGVVDWDQMVPCGLPGWDLLNLLSRLRIRKGNSWVDSLIHLAEEKWDDTEMELWNMYASNFCINWEMRSTLVWCLWLKVIGEGFLMNQALNYDWLVQNFHPVIDKLQGELDGTKC